MDKKWVIGIVTSIVVLPSLAFGWKNIKEVWAGPEKLTKVESRVAEQETSQEYISKLVIEQQARMDKQEAVSNLQVEALKEQLALVAELKKGKR